VELWSQGNEIIYKDFFYLFLFRRNDYTVFVRDFNSVSGFVHIMRVGMKYVLFSNSRFVESESRDIYIGIFIS
jgi:hypothetical protein